MKKGKLIKIINGLKIYRFNPGLGEKYIYSLWCPDLTECIYKNNVYDEKDWTWLAKHINYYKKEKNNICVIYNYSEDDLYNGFRNGKEILNVLHLFNKKHNINEIIEEY